LLNERSAAPFIGAGTVQGSLNSRIEGLVVIELERYRSAQHCSDDNDMTWWMLP
jgi:hypothetical protein